MSDLESHIENWSDALAERLLEIRFIDIDLMKASMKVHLKSAMMDCLRIQLTETESRLIETKKHYINFGGGKNNHIQAEIVELKRKKKEQVRLYAKLDIDNQNRELVLWMRKHHESSLLEFYKTLDEKYPKTWLALLTNEPNDKRSAKTE